jgi:predicted CXXCH cytochrome family protein
MKKTPRFAFAVRRHEVVLGVLIVWALLLVACSSITTTRTVVDPLTIPGATYVGSGKCALCHDDVTRRFKTATHARLMAATENDKNIGCEACHGPGSLHAQAGDGTNILNPRSSPETCFACHLDKRAEFRLANSHPVMSGAVTCTSCHDPHSGDAIKGGGTQIASLNATCAKCHTTARGPFAFEHEALREGCTICHSPHGSVNAKMLKARNQMLCLQCHAQQQTAAGALMIGGRNHNSFVTRGTCWTAGCHEAVHGSHVNSSLRY